MKQNALKFFINNHLIQFIQHKHTSRFKQNRKIKVELRYLKNLVYFNNDPLNPHNPLNLVEMIRFFSILKVSQHIR